MPFTVAIEHARDSSSYAAHVDSFFLREIVYLSLRHVARGKNLRQIVSFAPRSIFLFSYLFSYSYPRTNHIPLHQKMRFGHLGRLRRLDKFACGPDEPKKRDRFHSHWCNISKDNDSGVAFRKMRLFLVPTVFRCWEQWIERKKKRTRVQHRDADFFSFSRGSKAHAPSRINAIDSLIWLGQSRSERIET